jgi:REP element-mobilizing transposase RayT
MIGLKSSVTKRINLLRNTPGKTVWQRNFWEHTIRDDESYDKIVEYITTNPENWRKDKLFTS